MSVVDGMRLLEDAPIYTVHENFITTAEYSYIIPKIFYGVFRNMGPPLSIINEFIYMNVFEHSSNEPFTTSKVISKERLKTALEANVPESIKKNKKMMATWNERISGILTA